MEIKKAIIIWENVLLTEHLERLQKFCNQDSNFIEAATVGENSKDKEGTKARETLTCPLSKFNKSMTSIRWYNYFYGLFKSKIKEYVKHYKYEFLIKDIQDIEILKYVKKGRYVFHIDDSPLILPRSLSMIFLINDEYSGGELCFSDPMSGEEFVIPKKKNTLLMWPSMFLYPHAVKPVESGIRYSIVGWAR